MKTLLVGSGQMDSTADAAVPETEETGARIVQQIRHRVYGQE